MLTLTIWDNNKVMEPRDTCQTSYHITVKKMQGKMDALQKKIQRNGDNKTAAYLQQFHDCSQ